MDLRLAVVGDVHGWWDARDVAWFDRSPYAAVLFTGDLPGRLHHDLFTVARSIGALQKPAVLIPGNHDGPSPIDVLREALWSGIGRWGAKRLARRVEALQGALGAVIVGGYSRHRLGVGSEAIDLVVARPHAMDGRKLTFAPYLAERFGVANLDDSTSRLVSLLEGAERPVVILAHNGPAGFGSGRADPWGLAAFGRDNGDPDLAAAIDHMVRLGRPPLAVLTGHMHWNQRRERLWNQRRDGVLYVNAAHVPRCSGRLRRHVSVWIRAGEAHADLVEAGEAVAAAPAGRTSRVAEGAK